MKWEKVERQNVRQQCSELQGTAASSSRTDVMEDARKKLVNYIPLVEARTGGLYRPGELARRYFMKPSIYKIGQTLSYLTAF